MSARGKLLASILRCRDAVLRGLAPAEVARILEAEAQSLEHRPLTRERLAHLQRLERQLAHLPAGERAAAIRERMGISRSGYYKLRALALSPRTNVDSRAV